eukprot:g1922.t1
MGKKRRRLAAAASDGTPKPGQLDKWKKKLLTTNQDLLRVLTFVTGSLEHKQAQQAAQEKEKAEREKKSRKRKNEKRDQLKQQKRLALSKTKHTKQDSDNVIFENTTSSSAKAVNGGNSSTSKAKGLSVSFAPGV